MLPAKCRAESNRLGLWLGRDQRISGLQKINALVSRLVNCSVGRGDFLDLKAITSEAIDHSVSFCDKLGGLQKPRFVASIGTFGTASLNETFAERFIISVEENHHI